MSAPAPQIYSHASYRSYLRACAESRIARNPAYSVRAFALQLGLTPAFLSEILSGKKHLSSDKALKISKTLSLGETEARYFSLLIQAEKAKTSDLKQNIIRQMREIAVPAYEFRNMSLEHFQVIADWYHLAIRNLVLIEGYVFSPENVAHSLGISLTEAKSAIERLQLLGLIRVNAETGRWERGEESFLAHAKSVDTASAVQRYHEQTLELGLQAYRHHPRNKRSLTSLMVAADEQFIEKFDALADRFLRDANRLADQSSSKKKLYHVSFHGFEITGNLNPKRPGASS